MNNHLHHSVVLTSPTLMIPMIIIIVIQTTMYQRRLHKTNVREKVVSNFECTHTHIYIYFKDKKKRNKQTKIAWERSKHTYTLTFIFKLGFRFFIVIFVILPNIERKLVLIRLIFVSFIVFLSICLPGRSNLTAAFFLTLVATAHGRSNFRICGGSGSSCNSSTTE